MRELEKQHRLDRTGDRRYDMEALVHNLAAAGVTNDATTIRVITRYEVPASDFNLETLQDTERGWRMTAYDVYAFSYDAEEDLLILQAD